MSQTSRNLYHVSDVAGISLFEPRIAPPRSGIAEEVVWAVDSLHLHNYLLPRDCPRVTFYADKESHPNDIERLIGPGGAKHIVAIESDWYVKMREERLHLYEFDAESFFLHDPIAGYYLSRQPVTPISERCIEELPGELLKHDVELRIMPSLWGLREAVVESSLAFSIIRMRNAAPPPEGFLSRFPV